MSQIDRRAEIRKYALRAPELTPRERVILAGLTELREEIDPHTGMPPRDCYAMKADGKFRHRQEYVADTFGFSPGQIKVVFKNLRDKGALSTLSAGAHGRASAYQALILRGSENDPLKVAESQTPRGSKNLPATPSENDPLWNPAIPTTRGSENDPHTYRTPDPRNHSPASREEPSPRGTQKSAARNEHPPTSVASPVAAAYGVTTTCPHGQVNGDQRDPWQNHQMICPACRQNDRKAS